MKLYQLCFSPTGGTKKVLDLFCAPWDCEKAEADLSDPDLNCAALSFTSDDLCVVAVPSYEGRVPPLLVPRLGALRGNGARAVLIAVFGNRAYDDTLLELADLLGGAGFRCAAGVAAVAEHSILRAYGAGRPDEADARELADFSARCQAALGAGGCPEVQFPGARPYRAPGGLPGFLHPTAGSGCNGCGLCARKCPARAIPPALPATVDKTKCIACMRCVSLCPQHVRHANGAFIAIGTWMLRKKCAEHKRNELFL